MICNAFGENLFNRLIEVNKKLPNKFPIDKIEYKGRNLFVFQYGLTTPKDFGVDEQGSALDTRGTVFEVDGNGQYLATVALPYEKFFNLHEFDYEGSTELLKAMENRYGITFEDGNSTDILRLVDNNEEDIVVMDKRDGSIIAFFDFYGELDSKSNWSLTSEYKREGLKLVENNQELYNLVWDVAQKGYCVITEYTSSRSDRQIVLPYSEDKITVTGVRSMVDGSYLSFEEVEAIFGQYTVDTYDFIDRDIYKKEDTEGYVVSCKGLRFKMKTEWYINRSKAKETFTPSVVWKAFIENKVDDILALIPKADIPAFESFLNKSEALYYQIVDKGESFYEENKDLDSKEYFTKLSSKFDTENPIDFCASGFAQNLRKNDRSKALARTRENLTIRKKMTMLGIPLWTKDNNS